MKLLLCIINQHSIYSELDRFLETDIMKNWFAIHVYIHFLTSYLINLNNHEKKKNIFS